MRDSSRIVRDRVAGLRDAIDRAAAPAAVGAARRLVQVYDGGAMPTLPDRVYLTHPVAMDGAGCEGCPGTPVADTSSTIPVVFLRGVPAVGDLAVATAVGGRWVAEIGGPPQPTCTWFCGVRVTIAHPDGCQGATAIATVGKDGTITGLTLADPGDCYYVVAHPAVTITAPPGAGAGAAALATVGQVVSLAVTDNGKGYNPAAPPPATIPNPSPGGSAATVNVAVDPGDGSLSLTLVDGGSLYSAINPLVVIDPPPPGGKQAKATATAKPGLITSLKLTSGGGGYFYPDVPPALDFTISCPAWTYSVRLLLGKAASGVTPHADTGCSWGGQVAVDIPPSSVCPGIPGVLMKVAVYQSLFTGGYVVTVNWVDAATGSQLGADPAHTFTCECGSPFGVLFDTRYCNVAGSGAVMTADGPQGPTGLACAGRPYSWSYTTFASWVASEQWYSLGGGNCPTHDPLNCVQPPVLFALTLTEPPPSP